MASSNSNLNTVYTNTTATNTNTNTNTNTKRNSPNKNKNTRKNNNAKVINFQNFRFNVSKDRDYIKIKVGPEDFCSKILIPLDKDDNNAVLSLFVYGEDCNITKNLAKSNGTKTMMKTIINFIKSQYPHINTLVLTDASIFICMKYENSTREDAYINPGISMYDIYLCKYGVGYYEKNYGFKLMSADSLEQQAKNSKIVNEIEMTNELLYGLQAYIISEPQIIPADISLLRKQINIGETLANFIKRIKITPENCGAIMALFSYCKVIYEDFKDLPSTLYALSI